MEHKDPIFNIRHSLAHVMARAVLEHFPDALLTIGPPTENGFYYDFSFSTPITDKDLPKIEKTMRKIIPTWNEFAVREVSEKEAREMFKGNTFKLELIDAIVSRGEKLTVYTSGDFADLCAGPHVASARELDTAVFKLTHIAGAYWKGDENREMLTRVYALAFGSKEELEAYEAMLKEAKDRDHRKLGKELDLFTFSDLVGPGLPLFTPKGTALRQAIVDKIYGFQKEFGYTPVSIPHITKKELYQTSGHWEKFGDELFQVKSREGAEFIMKPMNCPHHTQIYASQMRSYKDLPLRYTEATMVYRDEQAGELLGLSRVRSITQDDGHVFCTPEQMEDEIGGIIAVIKKFYTSLDLFTPEKYSLTLSVRDPNTPEKYLGEDATWDLAENTLESVAKKNNLEYVRAEGDASFYGPKLDFIFKDALGRKWQLATAQLDFQMPKRFGLEYVDRDGTRKTPVMIHRAIAGSLERFLSVIIEHFAGAFPFWMSPVQVAIIPIKETHDEKAREVFNSLSDLGYRAEITRSADAFGKRIRQAKNDKVPYVIIIGDKDIEAGKVTLESRDAGQIGQVSVEDILVRFKTEQAK
ncbi:MAG: threonine--tRNA ligase [Candidatus Paceibacterota bacterium]